MQKVYFIPGLGANKHLFEKLVLKNIESVYLEYFKPQPHENIEHYAMRMREKITEPEPVIAGVSFGALMANEIALQIPVRKLIIISSIKNYSEKPLRYKMIEVSNLQNLVSVSMLKNLKSIAHIFFGTKTSDEIKLLNALIDNADPEIVSWSINAFIKWKRKSVPSNCIHIHGSADRVFPIDDVKANHIIENGTHLMIYSKAAEVSELLNSIIQK